MRLSLPFVSLLAATMAAPMAHAQQADPPRAEVQRPAPPLALTGRVVDEAQLIDAPSENAMSDMLARLEGDLGVQFVVVSTPSLRGMAIEDYSLALGNGWALGNAGTGAGLTLLVAPNERQARIEVGTGLEPVLTDEFCQAIINLMLPSFREGNYADGISIGVVSLDTRLRKVAAERAG